MKEETMRFETDSNKPGSSVVFDRIRCARPNTTRHHQTEFCKKKGAITNSQLTFFAISVTRRRTHIRTSEHYIFVTLVVIAHLLSYSIASSSQQCVGCTR